MVLSDVDIREVIMRGELVAEDVDDASIQPASIDLHLSPYFQVFDDDDYVIDPKQDQRHLSRHACRSDEHFPTRLSE
jgi:deoxycytidine triphosphate deaminase